MMMSQAPEKMKFRILAGISYLLTGFMAFINLSEFLKIGLLKQSNDYPFGGEGPVPWYYKTAELYAKVTLCFGLLFLVTLLFAIWSAVRKKQICLFVSVLVSIFLIIIQIVNI